MKKQSIDKATNNLFTKAKEGQIKLAWDRLELQQPQCGFGTLGICCRNCAMGPCRIDPFGEGADSGVCGATADTISARNFIRMIAGGAAAHSDHGRAVAEIFLATAEGKVPGYEIKDEMKLLKTAYGFGSGR